MQNITVDKEFEDMRLDRYIGKAYKELSKVAIQKMIRTGGIKVNGKKTDASTHLKADDEISVYIAPSKDLTPAAKKDLWPPEIIYEDDFFLAVNKPAGLITHPDGKKDDSLTDRIIMYLHEKIKQYNGLFVPGVINRLDINTSGIVLAPKTPQAAKAMNDLMQKNKFTKKYLVLVKGVFPKRLKATHYALKDVELNKMELFDAPQKNSEEMVTVFDPIESKGGYTLLSAQLITGKTHQIRAQLGKLRFPVAGDIKYGDAEFNKEMKMKYNLHRQFLHCYSVSFPMWTDHSVIKVICAPPKDLQSVLSELKIDFQV